MKEHPDANDTLRAEGVEALRARHHFARKFEIEQYAGADDNGPRGQQRFKLVPFDQLRPEQQSGYLIKGIIPRVGIVVIWGPPKCGKTFWTFDLVMHWRSRAPTIAVTVSSVARWCIAPSRGRKDSRPAPRRSGASTR